MNTASRVILLYNVGCSLPQALLALSHTPGGGINCLTLLGLSCYSNCSHIQAHNKMSPTIKIANDSVTNT